MLFKDFTTISSKAWSNTWKKLTVKEFIFSNDLKWTSSVVVYKDLLES